MNQDEIIAMAKEAGFQEGWLNLWATNFEHFATLVAAKEREACAQLAGDSYYGNPGELNHEIAAAIRARGTKEGA